METKYISKKDFHNGREFQKTNKSIDTSLKLIARLISYNLKCKSDVKEKLKISHEVIDFRQEQFDYIDSTLKNVYYSCYSLKNVFEVSTFMNFKGIENSIPTTLENQRRYITFNAIVKLSSIFEFTRKEYDESIDTKSYMSSLKIKYPKLGESLELLNNFRNTIHNNAKWNGKIDLTYLMRGKTINIKPNQEFRYTHWLLYRIIKDSIELSRLLALDNQEKKIIRLRGAGNLAMMRTEMTLDDWDNLINKK